MRIRASFERTFSFLTANQESQALHGTSDAGRDAAEPARIRSARSACLYASTRTGLLPYQEVLAKKTPVPIGRHTKTLMLEWSWTGTDLHQV